MVHWWILSGIQGKIIPILHKFSQDQLEYQEEMKANYREMAKELSEIMHEQVGVTQESSF